MGTASETYAAKLDLVRNICHYPVWYYKGHTLVYPSGSDEFLALQYDRLTEDLLLNSNGIWTDPADFNIFFYVQHYLNGHTLVLGPFSEFAHMKELQFNYCKNHKIADKFSLPVWQASESQAQSAEQVITDLLSQTRTDILSSDQDHPLSNPDSAQDIYHLHEYYMNTGNMNLPTTPYILEKILISDLQSGNEEKFFSTLREIGQYRLGKFSDSTLKSQEYGLVIIISTFTRAVIDVGVSYDDAFSLSAFLLNKVTLASTTEEYNAIAMKAYTQYLSLVKSYKNQTQISPHITNCQAYISHHLNKPLSPELIANELSISKDYLLHLFSETTGTPLMEYIRNERIESAKNMLKYSDFSIQRIADYYQFRTQSHFGVVFKSVTGMSPSEYRKKISQRLFKKPLAYLFHFTFSPLTLFLFPEVFYPDQRNSIL